MFKKYISLITLFIAFNLSAQTTPETPQQESTVENTSLEDKPSNTENETAKKAKAVNDRKDIEKPGLGENERFEGLGIAVPPSR